ncbi:hypothetical protein NVS47_06755 [Dehalobacterium formicoaceticum]|uniref:ArsC family protein n=1 Tax=Dehalobacterium formicoaceticum TaxID=51515 RepID=A0ABT1Y4Y8_9FIRM|nr:ArsC/Spx/MgsR family protein [Dehalobacterium formicoaceticum]MCR6545215.1 hypothetical protein [Dehalobacterium formicoaceticum]
MIAQRKKIPIAGLINPKSRNLKDLGIKPADLENLTEETALTLLTKNPKIMFRPIVLTGEQVLLGFKEEEFNKLIPENK